MKGTGIMSTKYFMLTIMIKFKTRKCIVTMLCNKIGYIAIGKKLSRSFFSIVTIQQVWNLNVINLPLSET